MNRLSILLGLWAVLSGCHKDDIDVATLNTNRFDADFPGDNGLFTIDSIFTRITVGTTCEQALHVRVRRDLFIVDSEYIVRLVEEAEPEIVRTYYSQLFPDDLVICRNNFVTLGTEYCYNVELVVNDDVVRTERICAVAQL